jgi:hypothetical protein
MVGCASSSGECLRLILIGIVCLLVGLATGCSKKGDTVARLEGSEPQRLSFGRPEEVQQAFTAQMKSCWFDGPSAPLADYQYDTKSTLFETADGPSKLHQVTIRSGEDDDDRLFVVQFFPFNSNTLISTRNLSLPLDVAARLKRDIETWIFGRTNCGSQIAQTNALPATQPPQISASRVQQAPDAGWKTGVDGEPAASSSVY